MLIMPSLASDLIQIREFFKIKVLLYGIFSRLEILAHCIIISPDESRVYIGLTSVVPPPPHVLTCVRGNSKTLSRISFKLGTHMYLDQERNPILR